MIIKPSNTLKIRHHKVLDAYFAERINTPQYKSSDEKEPVKHKVVSGDTLSKIAKKYSTTVAKIKADNGLTSDTIYVGKTLSIGSQPKKEKIGDKVTFKSLKSANLGDEVYVVVKTSNLANKKVWLNVNQGKEKGVVEKDTPMTLQHEGKELTRPEAIVGAYAKDDKITNKTDFKDWAIFKITLGGKDTKKEREALDKLKGKKAFMYLLIDAHSPNNVKVVYNGKNPDKEGEPDKRNTPNYWLDIDGKWFELKKGCGIEITSEILKQIFPKSKSTRRKEVADAINKYKCEFEINNLDRMAHFLGQIGTETSQLNALKESYNYSAKNIYNTFLRKVLIKHPTNSKKYTFKYHDLIEGYDATLTCEYSSPKTSSEKNYGHKRDVEDPIEVTKKNGKASWSYDEFSELYSIKDEYIKDKKLFDYVYGCRMGNGKRSTEDGSDYFGVGFIHLTGKNKYKALHDKWNELYPNDKKDFMGDDISLLKTDVDVAMKASMIIWTHVQVGTNNEADKGNNKAAIIAVTKDVNGGTNGLNHREKFTKKAYEILKKENEK
ncbi:LysM peptidoglycan-binding domain-containing protein [Tenacibaculum larymnensis]|uniref:LysM peptidoglycan-binding domain-containing protein n=1 Tax=Tenacibaculum larymnensis TaxID=2878201 RepID=UPI00237B2374|nr:LysM peptidoglycan-binding domain-containing protein [Tenacibaculum larymnensis]